MSTDLVSALCGACKIPLEGPVDGDDQSVFSCPGCGRSDTRENVLREVAEHVKEVTARHLQEEMRAVARGSKFISYKGDPIPHRSYRFVSNFKL